MLDVWDQRVELARQKFNTQIEIRSHGWGAGQIGVGVWARTWTWGDLISDATFHALVPIGVDRTEDDVRDAVTQAMNRVHEAALRARKMFTDTVPCQIPGSDAQGRISIVESTYNTDSARAHQQLRGYTRDDFAQHPEEALPRMGGGSAYLDALVFLGRRSGDFEGMHFDWRDDLNSYALPRYVRDTRPVLWQYEAKPSIRTFDGVRISAAGQHKLGLSVERPDGEAAARTMMRMITEARQAFRDAAPEMPAGYDRFVPQPLPAYDGDDVTPE